METVLSRLRQWLWRLLVTAVVLAPSFRSVDYKSYAVSLGFFLLLFLSAIPLFKKPEFLFSRLEILLFFYVGWVCLSYFWSPVGLAAAEYAGRFLPCVGLFWLVRQENRAEPGPGLVRAWALLALLACVYGLFQKAGMDFIGPYAQAGPAARVFSTFGNPNVFAAFLVLTAPTVLLNPLWSGRANWEKTFRVVLALLLFLNLLLTGSRAGFLGLALELILFLFHFGAQAYRNKKTRPALLALSVLMVLGGGYLAAKAGFRPTERLQVWLGAARMAAAKPVFGWGIGQFSLNFGSYLTPELAGRMAQDNTFAEHAHNEVLETGVELGLVGLALACLFWGTLMGRAWAKLSAQGDSTGGFAPSVGPTLGLLGLGLTNLLDYNCRLSGIGFFLWVSAAVLARSIYPPDKLRFPRWLGRALGIFLIAGFGTGTLQTVQSLASVLLENPREDFLKDLPANPSDEERKIRTGIEADPGNPTHYHELGNIYAKLNRMEDARKAFQKELDLNPGSAGAYLNLGNICFLESGSDPRQLDRALEDYAKSVRLDPNSVEGHFNMAYVYFVKKDLKDALGQLEEVLKRDPQNAKALALKRQILP